MRSSWLSPAFACCDDTALLTLLLLLLFALLLLTFDVAAAAAADDDDDDDEEDGSVAKNREKPLASDSLLLGRKRAAVRLGASAHTATLLLGTQLLNNRGPCC